MHFARQPGVSRWVGALDREVKNSLTTPCSDHYRPARREVPQRPELVSQVAIASNAGNRGGVSPLVLATVSGGLIYVMHAISRGILSESAVTSLGPIHLSFKLARW